MLLDYEHIKENILNDENYVTAIQDKDSNNIAKFMVNQINFNLDQQSEIKKVKINKRENFKYSVETINKIAEKNQVYKQYKKEKRPEDKILLKNLIKEVDTLKKKENKVKNLNNANS